jgi:hypothetical protein
MALSLFPSDGCTGSVLYGPLAMVPAAAVAAAAAVEELAVRLDPARRTAGRCSDPGGGRDVAAQREARVNAMPGDRDAAPAGGRRSALRTVLAASAVGVASSLREPRRLRHGWSARLSSAAFTEIPAVGARCSNRKRTSHLSHTAAQADASALTGVPSTTTRSAPSTGRRWSSAVGRSSRHGRPTGSSMRTFCASTGCSRRSPRRWTSPQKSFPSSGSRLGMNSCGQLG